MSDMKNVHVLFFSLFLYFITKHYRCVFERHNCQDEYDKVSIADSRRDPPVEEVRGNSGSVICSLRVEGESVSVQSFRFQLAHLNETDIRNNKHHDNLIKLLRILFSHFRYAVTAFCNYSISPQRNNLSQTACWVDVL